MNLSVYFYSEKENTTGYIGQVWERRFENSQWVPTRLMNRDETFHNSWLRVFGRTFESSEDLVKTKKIAGEPDAYSPVTKKNIITPGIYKVITYERWKL